MFTGTFGVGKPMVFRMCAEKGQDGYEHSK